jgi:hypothetical protein
MGDHCKRVAILQSNYIPWKGYFDIINSVDEFVLYDDMQYTKNDWRNRNRIKTPQGLQWLTIPVRQESLAQKINETKTADQRWREKHWKALVMNYSRADYFKEYSTFFKELYLGCHEEHLSRINWSFLTAIARVLGIETSFRSSSEFNLCDGKTERLVDLCQQLNATEYLSGPAAQGYLDVEAFAAANIKVTWIDYGGYPEYRQLYPPFEHGVSVLDLIFSEGPNARQYTRRF